ncbi:MAG: AMP-binding enzyme, partial [Desulfomonilaceae bacterium]
NAVASHPAVKDVAVIGVPHEKWGESVHAFVILKSGIEPSSGLKDEIKRLAKTKIAGYKAPKSIDFISDEDMPRTGTGKILHRVLREQYGTWSSDK